MADLRIRALWQGDPVKKGITDLKADVHGLGTALSGVRGFAITALGIGGLLGAATQVNAALRSTNTELMIERRMMETLRTRSGDWARDSVAARKMVLDLQRSSKFADDELMDGLAQLTRLTGNTTTALTNMGLAAQVAEAFNKDLSVGVQTVAFVSQGFLDKASRLIPEMKGLNAELGDLKGTSEAAAIGMRALTDAVQGGGSSTGIGQLTKGWNEFRDSIFKLAADADTADAAFRKWGATLLAISAAMDSIRNNPLGAAVLSGASKGGFATGRQNARDKGISWQNPITFNGMSWGQPNVFGWQGFTHHNTPWGNLGPAAANSGMDPWWWMQNQGPEWSGRPDSAGGGGGRTPNGISPYEYARDLPGFYRGAENRRGGIRGMGRGMDFFGGQLPQSDEPPAQQKWKAQRDRELQEYGGLLKSTVSEAMYAGMTGRLDDIGEVMKKKFASVFADLAGGLAGMAFGVAPTGLLAALTGRGGASSGAVSNSVAMGQQIQQARMAAARG